MRRKWLDTRLAQLLAGIWVGILVVGALAWLFHRRWRKWHPLPPREPATSYSRGLPRRFGRGGRSATSGSAGPIRKDNEEL